MLAKFLLAWPTARPVCLVQHSAKPYGKAGTAPAEGRPPLTARAAPAVLHRLAIVARCPPRAASRRRQAGSLLHRQGQERSGARLRLFRGGAGTGAAAILLTRDEAQRIRGELRQAAELSGRPLNHYEALGTTVAGLGDLRRLARHMRRGKSVHWHIDQLTERGIISGSWIVRNGRECDLVAMFKMLPKPISGFGSSDCLRCCSHLLYWPKGVRCR